MDYNLLFQQNAATSAAIITHLSKNKTFHSISNAEGKSIVQRDTEDAAKLQAGVELSIQAGQLSQQTIPPHTDRSMSSVNLPTTSATLS